MPRKEKEEDRTSRRVSVSKAVRIRCENWERFQTEYTGNISDTGIFITTEQPLSPGTVFTLEMSVGEETIVAKAQVIWTKEFAPFEKRLSGLGARFVDMDPQSERILQDWIADLRV